LSWQESWLHRTHGRFCVPWQRIVNSRGKISVRADGGSNLLQRDLLEIEGVCFDKTSRIDLNVHGWNFP
jgi:methylated-DNA-protein-cysteine methyltransferase-like protein